MTRALHRTAHPDQVGRGTQGGAAPVRVAVLTVVVAGLLGGVAGFVGDQAQVVRPGPSAHDLQPVGASASHSFDAVAQVASPPTPSPTPSPSPSAVPSPTTAPQEQAADPAGEPEPGDDGAVAAAPGGAPAPPPAPRGVTECAPVPPGSPAVYRLVVQETREQLDTDWPGAPGSSGSGQPMTDAELVDRYQLGSVIDEVESHEIVSCDGTLEIVGMPAGHLETVVGAEVHVALVEDLA